MRKGFVPGFVLALASAMLFHQTAFGEEMVIRSSNERVSKPAPPQYFTGAVSLEPLHARIPGPSRVSVGQVTFFRGAHSHWHTHPLGQVLIVTSGTGWIQEWGKPKREIKAGDVVWTPPGVKHWHGATSTTTMTHIAVQEEIDGRNVDWLEAVSDEDYQR